MGVQTHLEEDGKACERGGAGLADCAGDAAGEEVGHSPELRLVVLQLRLRLLLLRRVPPRGGRGGAAAVHRGGGHPHPRLRLHPPPPSRRAATPTASRAWALEPSGSEQAQISEQAECVRRTRALNPSRGGSRFGVQRWAERA